MAMLCIQNNIFYSCEVLHSDGRCFQHFFTGPAKTARSGAITFMLEYILSDDAKKGDYCLVSAHNLKTGEKITVTSSDLLYSVHEGLQQELKLWQQEGIKTDVVLFNYRQPQYVTLLLAGANFELLKTDDHILGIAEDWSVTFGRKKTKMNVAA
jgi:hypothetical protein